VLAQFDGLGAVIHLPETSVCVGVTRWETSRCHLRNCVQQQSPDCPIC
jgi:hypothetical protein